MSRNKSSVGKKSKKQRSAAFELASRTVELRRRDQRLKTASRKKSLFRENVEARDLPGKVKRDGKKRKSVQLTQTTLDSFTVLKQAEEALQGDISEESFNPPLHSTAVYTEDEELLEKSKASSQKSASRASSGPDVSQEKSGRKNRSAQKNKTAASECRSLTPRSVPEKKQKTQQKTATSARDLEASGKGGPEPEEEEETGSNQQTPPAEQATDKKTYEKTKPKVKGKKSPKKKESNKSKQKEKIQLTVWSPEDAPLTAKNVNELDVILFESESLVNHYRESIDGACRKAVDNFFLSYKDQLTAAIRNVRMLKDMKRKNAKARLEIGRKQKRLIVVKDEIIKKQPRLNQLQRECSELEERQKSIVNAKTFLDNLGQLQEDYRKCRDKKPSAKETYGLSSLPALILQAQSTMRAEQHFHNVNAQLQNAQA
ncbi:centromere protein U isoform X2 [Rana temporaria]|uniref:centromere protein U isoform X2 n=1 Tax=Rana temporaria TaxID=8407 RepID=UPI001AAC8B93|nr:centromere protein U isoform X2 [Rana temporaria]